MVVIIMPEQYWYEISDIRKFCLCYKSKKYGATLSTIIHPKKQNSEIKAVEDNCYICLQGYSEKDSCVILRCGHKYHFDCFFEWAIKKRFCPTCHEKLGHAVISSDVIEEIKPKLHLRTRILKSLFF